MTVNTQQKAPGACDSKGLHTDTNASYFASHGPIQQDPDSNSTATLAGHHVIKGTHGDFTCCKFGLTRYCADFAELVAFAKKVGAA